MDEIILDTCKKNEIVVEWGGVARCITSDGRNVNIADELNAIENEKNECTN